MTEKRVPFSRELIERLTETHPTPFHIYDEEGIRATAREFSDAFSWVEGYRNYYAVKALPNPAVLNILADEGMGFDCSSLAELMLVEHIDAPGYRIFFTSNNTPAEEFAKARRLHGTINLDDYTHIDYLTEHVGMPDRICLRYNPGRLKEGNSIIGVPTESKFGFTRDQIIAGFDRVAEFGATEFGLHTMVASNELDPDYFVETARILFELAVEVLQKVGVRISFVNLGGGIGIPYRPEEDAVDLRRVSRGVRRLYGEILEPAGLVPMQIFTESGRAVTGAHGYLVSRVGHIKKTYKTYVGLDASMANLMRPGMYGAYHHITVLGKEDRPADCVYDLTGSLCENNDKFTIDRRLPELEIGDLIVIHDTGAHGHSMGFNYNGKLRSAELLLRPDGSIELIRRAETLDDLFATLDLSGSVDEKGSVRQTLSKR